MNKKRILPIIFLAFVAFVIYSTMSLGKVTCTVCIEYQGAEACRTASGEDRESAVRTATENACAQVTSGMSNTRNCLQQPPVSVECGD
ncbi:MAG: hypothetical protein JSU96_17350 [Acidobacteriota bacterium]|nr:MAG: hypothetical protein JSU96_17350 [Acidobacteriota bacterium]